MAYDQARVQLIFDLLEQTTSISVVSDYLKQKGLAHSAGSWEQLIDKRIRPALNAFELSEADLLNLLRSVEEHGRQHVFLFRCPASKAKELLSVDRIKQILRSKHLLKLIDTPRILDQPEEPTITDVRFGDKENGSLILKEVERRTRKVLQNEQQGGGFLTVTYKLESKRAVNMVRLHSDGLLEIRVGSHDLNSRTQYERDVSRLMRVFSDFLSGASFFVISLEKAKEYLFKNGSKLSDIVRFSTITMHNDDDTRMTASVGNADVSLLESDAIQSGLGSYTKYPGHCEGSNIYFLPTTGGLSKERHVLLSGAINEFAIPVNCSQSDYEYILGKIRAYNA